MSKNNQPDVIDTECHYILYSFTGQSVAIHLDNGHLESSFSFPYNLHGRAPLLGERAERARITEFPHS